jgi:hypothetical protein
VRGVNFIVHREVQQGGSVLRIRRVVVVGLMMVGAGACRSSHLYEMSDAERATHAGTIAIHVINKNNSDVDVYVLSDGIPTRLGSVAATSNDTFYADQSLFGTSRDRIVAIPTIGRGIASSRPLSVSPGQTIEFTIGSVLSMSTTSIR